MNRTPLAIACCFAWGVGLAQFCEVTITHEIIGTQVQYAATSADEPAQYSWFFNGGTPSTSSEQNPVVTYSAPGEYICAVSISGGPNDCSAALSTDQDTVQIGQTGITERSDPGFSLDLIGDSRIVVHNDRAQWVDLGIFDLTGKRVRSIFSGHLAAGPSRFDAHSFDLPEGIYLLTVNTLDGSMTRRFPLRR